MIGGTVGTSKLLFNILRFLSLYLSKHRVAKMLIFFQIFQKVNYL